MGRLSRRQAGARVIVTSKSVPASHRTGIRRHFPFEQNPVRIVSWLSREQFQTLQGNLGDFARRCAVRGRTQPRRICVQSLNSHTPAGEVVVLVPGVKNKLPAAQQFIEAQAALPVQRLQSRGVPESALRG